jgi:hypothetical protein
MQECLCSIPMNQGGVNTHSRSKRVRFIFLHSSTIVSMSDLTQPNLPVHNKLIFAKKMKRTLALNEASGREVAGAATLLTLFSKACFSMTQR